MVYLSGNCPLHLVPAVPPPRNLREINKIAPAHHWHTAGTGTLAPLAQVEQVELVVLLETLELVAKATPLVKTM